MTGLLILGIVIAGAFVLNAGILVIAARLVRVRNASLGRALLVSLLSLAFLLLLALALALLRGPDDIMLIVAVIGAIIAQVVIIWHLFRTSAVRALACLAMFLVLSTAVSTALREYLAQAFKIPTAAMLPTLVVGDYILVNKFIYGAKIPFTDKRVLVWQEPEQGDIVVFEYPQDPSRNFIKRIVAVEGDVVESRGKRLWVNGQPLEEPYVRHEEEVIPRGVDPRDTFGPLTVPPGKVFVMGDNRDHSFDSRYWGFVDEDAILGKPFYIYWSWNSDENRPRLDRMGRLPVATD